MCCSNMNLLCNEGCTTICCISIFQCAWEFKSLAMIAYKGMEPGNKAIKYMGQDCSIIIAKNNQRMRKY